MFSYVTYISMSMYQWVGDVSVICQAHLPHWRGGRSWFTWEACSVSKIPRFFTPPPPSRCMAKVVGTVDQWWLWHGSALPQHDKPAQRYRLPLSTWSTGNSLVDTTCLCTYWDYWSLSERARLHWPDSSRALVRHQRLVIPCTEIWSDTGRACIKVWAER